MTEPSTGLLDDVGAGARSGPVVACEQVSRTFGSGRTAHHALVDATCAVATDERIAVVGPSGSGKSTLLHLMADLDRATSGQVNWPGLPARPSRQPGLVGIVFQAPSLMPSLTVIENVALPLLITRRPPQEAALRALAALVDLDIGDLADRLPDELSGGQSQRVAVARALAPRPALILADEPTGQLDHRTSTHVVDALVEAAEVAGAALVVATHDPLVASHLTTRWQMRDGTLATGIANRTEGPR
ncbi:MAG: ABC transporter ATP-binding protein [Nocardioidaceae bacterium]